MSFNNLDQLYRQVIMDPHKTPRNKGVLAGDTLSVEMKNPTCGDRIQLQLQVEGDSIRDVKFDAEGCSISTSSASTMTESIQEKTVDDEVKMSLLFSDMMLGKEIDTEVPELDDIEALQRVSKFPARIKCATLAWKAMEKGVHEE